MHASSLLPLPHWFLPVPLLPPQLLPLSLVLGSEHDGCRGRIQSVLLVTALAVKGKQLPVLIARFMGDRGLQLVLYKSKQHKT